MKTLLLTSMAVAAVAMGAPVLANGSVPPATATAPKAQTMPARTVTRTEVTQRVQQQFARLDANRDGFVTKAEAEAAAGTMHERMSQRLERRGAAMFERLDTNKDGTVTRAEAEPLFTQGSVDIAHSGPGDRKPRRNWDALASRFDSNKDGNISRAEFEAGQAHHAQKIAERRAASGMRHAGLGGRMFEMADADKDGRVSLAEATAGAAARFDAADSNRDGMLTGNELLQARGGTRAKGGSR